MESKSKYIQHIIGANIPIPVTDDEKRSDEFIGFRAWNPEPRDMLTFLEQLRSQE